MQQFLDELRSAVAEHGPERAIDLLCARLRDRKEYHALFYALLMKKRLELGVSPIATASNTDLPPETHPAFEETIRQASRTVGDLFLAEGDIPQAWAYHRMIGETGPVAAALEKRELAEDEDAQPLVDIALYQGVLPAKGFDWVLQRYGICNAITTMGSADQFLAPPAKEICVRRLVRALHSELMERLKAEIQAQQNFAPAGKTVAELIAGRDWLFGEEAYHIDLSHLSSVVQMSLQLDGGEELHLARDLCAYGKKLSPRFLFPTDPPFEKQYEDWDLFLGILTGEAVDEGLAHFRTKAAEADPETIGTYPAEVLVNLLLRVNRPGEALAAAREFLADVPADVRLSCPNLTELCQRTGDYATLQEIAREQGNPVNFLAGLIGAGKG